MELLQAGVKIYEYKPGFIHAKMFVSDDDRAVVGSINLDYRSLFEHFECATFIYNNPVVVEIEEDVRKVLEKCITVTEEYYRSLPFMTKLLGRVFRIFGSLM
jgi:cardiolipin synthase